MSYRQLNFILIDPICYKQILIINIGPDLEVQHSPTWTVLGISLILKKKRIMEKSTLVVTQRFVTTCDHK